MIEVINDYGISSTDLIFIESSFKTTIGNYQYIVSRYQGVAPSDYYGWFIRVQSNGDVMFHTNNSQTASTSVLSNNIITNDTWYNAVISKPYGNSVTQELFMDGVKQIQTGTSQTGSTHINTVTIGRDDYSGALPFEGMIDEVRFSNIIRSDAWVKTNNDSLRDSLLTFSTAGTVSGTTFYFDGFVKELNTPVQRTLYIYRRNTGEFLGITTSSGDGGYYLETGYGGDHFIVCVDDEDGVQYEDLIISRAIPHIKGWTHEL